MKIYVLNNTVTGTVIATFQNELDIYKYVCSDIYNIINDYWDMTEINHAKTAFAFNSFVKNNKYSEAIDFWNNCDINNDGDIYQTVCFSIYYYICMNNVGNPVTHDDDYFTALNLNNHNQPAQVAQTTNTPFNSNGAICKICNFENKFAQATDPDGKYICYGCKS